MFLFNLSLPEFLALFGLLSSGVVALYLLDRVKKKHAVASLRFFTVVDKAPQYKHRRKLQQPWSLLLQILSLLLLLLAIAQLRLGSRARSGSDHVLVLDTSAWMSSQTARGRLIDQARVAARNYVKSLPAQDRVMLVRADALATPVTQFESDRRIVQRAIDETQPAAAMLNVDQALSFAEQTQKLRSQRAGDIVFVGAGRIPSDASAPAQLPPNLRVIAVNGPVENCGIRKLALHRSVTKPDTWDIFVAVKNYGAMPRSVPLVIGFGGAQIGSRRFTLAAGAEETATFQYATRSGGWLEARLMIREPFSLDDRAVLELPARPLILATVYSDQPGLLRPVFGAIPNVKATFLPTAQYKAQSDANIVVLDRFAPPDRPKADSLWIQPPALTSPIPVAQAAVAAKLTRWRSEHALAAGLHTRDVELPQTEILRAGKDDIPIAESNLGPLIVARAGKPKIVVFGFNPALPPMKYELATPVLFANIVRWMVPDVFTSYEVNAGTVGTVTVDLETETDPSAIQVTTENGSRLPFTMDGSTLRFFSGSPGVVRVSTGGRERVYSLTLPQAGEALWKPQGARTGIPRRTDFSAGSRDIWQWLALLGALGFIVDWYLFGRATRAVVASRSVPGNAGWRKAS